MTKNQKFILIGVFVLAFLAFLLVYPQAWDKFQKQTNLSLPPFPQKPFKLGLDLQGGTHLLYEADLSRLKGLKPAQALEAVRDVIERRINLFGVAEPVVQVNHTGKEWRLIVELAGVKDINKAIKMIGQTPYLDFRQERPPKERDAILKAQEQGQRLDEDPYFIPTELNGSHLKQASLGFDPNTYEPLVELSFTSEGTRLFSELTKKNLKKRLAIYLDGSPISAPVVQEVITSGKAVITGKFTPAEAKTLVRRLNAGALPVPITLVSQSSLGASLGQDSLAKSLKAAFWGVLAVILFLMALYRLPGILAILALGIYIVFILALYKLIPVTLTLSGIAGFILSIGMAVDANILIFERLREELRRETSLLEGIHQSFKRAWSSIRDGNVSTLITAFFLYIFGTSFVKGFAITLGLGVLMSMFTAYFITRLLLLMAGTTRLKQWPWLFQF